MKKVFIIGNWKSYKNSAGTNEWFHEINNYKLSITHEKEIILCVPFTVLSLAKSLIQEYNLPIKLGAQDISPFDEGKYTGEINGKQIKEFADYVIIGHSERRKYFSEDEAMVNRKIEEAISVELIPIVCVSEVSQMRNLPEQKNMIIAYEPLFAIGSGQPDSPENAEKISAEIQGKMENIPIIYGGSVTSQNVHSFTSMPTISGVLPGGASLNAQEFAAIITNA
jgi:triosephosphate isomerase